ncbi:MAG: AraC family transcriptional regulator [Bacteroidota bacterium]
MKINIQISPGLTQLQQMAEQFGVSAKDNAIAIPRSMGRGFCKLYELPHQIQLHHYQYCLNQQVEVSSSNPKDSGMYIININLSNQLLKKEIQSSKYELGIAGQVGVLFFSPGKGSSGRNEVNIPFEVVFFSIPQSTMDVFLKTMGADADAKALPFCHYAEIADSLKERLKKALDANQKTNFFAQQGALLEILGEILPVFYQEDWENNESHLKTADVEKLLMVRGILMNHIFGSAPKIDDLATNCAMSSSQLKAKFKALFGVSIYQYYLRSKLKVARRLILENEGTISEIGHRLGYTNLSQFSAQFKKYFGQSPSEIAG